MVIGLLTLTAIPTVTGAALGVSEQRKANERKNDERRMAKFHIDVESVGAEGEEEETEEDEAVNGMRLVLRNNKVYLADPRPSHRNPPSHTVTSFYIEYPELDETKHLKRGLGLVTTISDNPPMLGWIYVDKDTYELKYGNRSDSVWHIVGPWDWADDESVITLEDKRGFVAVREDYDPDEEDEEGGEGEGEGEWAVYFDRDGDELEGVLEEEDMLDVPFAPVVLRRRLIEVPKVPVSKGQEQAQAQAQGKQGSSGGGRGSGSRNTRGNS